MKFFETRKKQEHVISLETSVAESASITAMVKSEGWKIVGSHLSEQLNAYRTDLMLHCKSWEEYLDKRAKAHAINLLLTDIEEFGMIGDRAAQDLKDLLD